MRQGRGPKSERRRRDAVGTTASTARGWVWLILLLVSALVAGCTDLTESVVTPGSGEVDTSVPVGMALSTPSATPRGGSVLAATTPITAPERRRIYFTKGGDLWQLPVDNAAAPVVSGRDIMAFAPAPDGERVAVAFQSGQAGAAGATSFAIVNADSTTALELKESGLSGKPRLVRSMAWSPEGMSIAVAWEDGSIAVVGADGQVRQMVPPTPGSAPGALAWSSDGRSLLYLDPALPDQPTSLSTIDVASGQRHRLVESSGPHQAVIAAAWLPGRDAIAFVLSSPTSIDGGGDLFVVQPEGGAATLLAGGGRFAPVAGIVNLAASPDGHWLALTVYVPGNEKPTYQSLWLLDLNTREMSQVPTARAEAVTDLWWAAGQLIYRGIDQSRAVVPGAYTGTEPFTLYQVDPATLEVHERYRP